MDGRTAPARRAMLAIAGLAAGTILAVPAAPAAVAAPEFRYEVTRTAAQVLDIPGTAVTFDARTGETAYLWARNLSTRNVTALRAGDNIGNTFVLQCRNSSGDLLPGQRGAYWAANLVPPDERAVTPTLRWLFVAPDNDRFTCQLGIVSYSTIIENGRTVTMRIPAGAELARAEYPNTARWTLQSSDAATVRDGATLTTLGATFTPAVAGADRIAVTQDAALTTCKAGSGVPGCSGGSAANPGSTVRIWIEGRPQTGSGAACGVLLRSPAVTRFISTAKHHLTATNTLYLTESQLDGCAQIRLTLKTQHVSGNPFRVHAGLAFGGLAATHGVAFEYP
jgi:hypothetical protein